MTTGISRQHPFFSPIGCMGGLTLIAGLVAAVVFSGGAIFSPGELTKYAAKGTPLNGFHSHAEFQNDCTQCHAPLIGIDPERCEACHTTIGQERATGAGLHGKLKPDEVAKCDTCHQDHKGPGLNPNVTALKKFDHAILGFSLTAHVADYNSAPIECQGCHHGVDFKFEATTCVKCHGDYDPPFMLSHLQAFGQDCVACHDGGLDGRDKMMAFDHAQTRFPLEGKHAEAGCADCHTAEAAAKDTPAQCVACHEEPPVHAGVFSQDCSVCHTPTVWSPAKLEAKPMFRHADTAFQLVHHAKNFDGSALTCAACHLSASQGDFSSTTQSCTDCHSAYDPAFMTQHVQQYGTNCLSCHDGAGNMQNFDHSAFFVLDGQHASLECAACHKEQKFKGTPNQCVDCHAEPAIHAGVFGLQCDACHSTTAWAPARLTRHTFPLDHGEQGEIACATCHVQSYATYTCAACHAPGEMQEKHAEKGITGDRLLECAACHPTGREAIEGGN